MKKVTEETYCDRCGKKITWPTPIRIKRKLLIDWMDIIANRIELKGVSYNEDLCRECYLSLAEWLKSGQQK